MTRPVLGRLGPFVGGMNTSSVPSAINDNELVDCVNFEVDIDGSLVSRPPIVETVNDASVTTERLIVIGSGILGGVSYIFASSNVGTYAFNNNTQAWSTISANLVSRCCAQVADLIFFLPITGSAGQGGYWNGTAFTADANMPAAEAVVYYKQRIWTVPGMSASATATYNQLRFTEPINPAAPTPLTWTATNSIAISPGDGQKLVDIQIYNDNLLMFKQDSSYVFAFDVLPSDGAVKAVNTTIGASARACVVSHDNSSFVFHEGNVYEIVNYTFTKINNKVPFVLDTSTPPATTRADNVFLTILGDRLILRYFNRVYAYAIRTNTWSRWTSASNILQNFGPLVPMPTLTSTGLPNRYYAGNTITSFENVVVIQDGFDSTSVESMTCFLISKSYDFGQSAQFKRLAWWGVDAFGSGEVDGTVTPISLNGAISWAQLHAYTWSQLGSWQIPVAIDNSVTTQVITTSFPQRMFLKFLKAIRFRQANFKVTMTTDGTTSLGPARVYSVTAVVGVKQLVPEVAN